MDFHKLHALLTLAVFSSKSLWTDATIFKGGGRPDIRIMTFIESIEAGGSIKTWKSGTRVRTCCIVNEGTLLVNPL